MKNFCVPALGTVCGDVVPTVVHELTGAEMLVLLLSVAASAGVQETITLAPLFTMDNLGLTTGGFADR